VDNGTGATHPTLQSKAMKNMIPAADLISAPFSRQSNRCTLNIIQQIFNRFGLGFPGQGKPLAVMEIIC
jgi:hypothetical protein